MTATQAGYLVFCHFEGRSNLDCPFRFWSSQILPRLVGLALGLGRFVFGDLGGGARRVGL